MSRRPQSYRVGFQDGLVAFTNSEVKNPKLNDIFEARQFIDYQLKNTLFYSRRSSHERVERGPIFYWKGWFEGISSNIKKMNILDGFLFVSNIFGFKISSFEESKDLFVLRKENEFGLDGEFIIIFDKNSGDFHSMKIGGVCVIFSGCSALNLFHCLTWNKDFVSQNCSKE